MHGISKTWLVGTSFFFFLFGCNEKKTKKFASRSNPRHATSANLLAQGIIESYFGLIKDLKPHDDNNLDTYTNLLIDVNLNQILFIISKISFHLIDRH